MFIGVFIKLQQATISFVMSVCLYVCPHGTTQLPLDGFSWNMMFQENSSFIKIQQESWVLYLMTKIRFCSYLTKFFLE